MAMNANGNSAVDANPAPDASVSTTDVTVVEVVEEANGSVVGDAEVAAEWTFDLSDGLADDVAQAANEIAAGQFRPGFLIPVLAASIGAAYIGIWIGDRILPFGRTTVGKAAGAALGTLLADVISRKVRS